MNSIVRDNLMNVPNYAPYCAGDNYDKCGWPRLKWTGSQFSCGCGYTTQFPEDFIEEYKTKWGK